jgi:SAM-dependent methyltransferase
MDLKEAYRVREGVAYRHPWELSRASSIISVIKAKPHSTRYADIGAGDLYFTRELRRCTDLPVYAVDIGYPGIERNEEVICLPALDLLPEAEIDCMILLDVLEHVPDERGFLESALLKLKPSGILVITVPAFQSLFSTHDRFLEHKRRYNRKQLITVLKEVDIVVDRSFYFYLSLLFVRLLQVFLEKTGIDSGSNKGAGAWRYARRHPLTRILTALLNADFAIGRFMGGVSILLPGLSLCCLCHKRSS